MNSQMRPRAVVGLQWVVGIVLIVESLRLAFGATAALHFARAGMPLWMRPVLAWTEVAAAILFLAPATTVLGGYFLLVIFFVAAALHILHGEYDIGALLVYGMAVLVSLAYPRPASSEVVHDGR
jgi:DoxX-like family